MEIRRKAAQMERFSSERAAGSALTAERLGIVSGPVAERGAMVAAQRGEYRSSLTRGGQRVFILGLDTLGSLQSGSVVLGG